MTGLVLEDGVLEIACGGLLMFWLLYLYLVKDYGYWEEARVAHARAVFPVGSLPRLVLRKWTWAQTSCDLYRRFPGDRYAGFNYVSEPSLLLRDPSLIKRVLETDFDHFTDRGINFHPKDYFARNLYNLCGDEWKRMKSKMTPAYAAAKIEIMFCLVKSSSENLLLAIGKLPGAVKEVESKDLLSRFMVNIIAACALGRDVNSLEDSDCDFYRFVKGRMCYTWKTLIKIMALKSFPFFSEYHAFDFFDPEVKRFFFDVISEAIECRERNNYERCDFLGMMMQLKLSKNVLKNEEPSYSTDTVDSNEGLTLEEITAEMHLFVLMSHESTADTCVFCLFELACHKSVQEKLFEEVKIALDRHVDLSYQSLLQMTFMDQVMRLYPVFPVIMRNCTKPYKVPGCSLVLPKGMGVYVPVAGLHRDPDHFPHPDAFDPDRFSPENSAKRDPFVFLPFGAGPRTCMGFRFGLMMVKSALASIVSKYVVDLTPDTPVPLELKKTAFSASPKGPVRLTLTPREPK